MGKKKQNLKRFAGEKGRKRRKLQQNFMRGRTKEFETRTGVGSVWQPSRHGEANGEKRRPFKKNGTTKARVRLRVWKDARLSRGPLKRLCRQEGVSSTVKSPMRGIERSLTALRLRRLEGREESRKRAGRASRITLYCTEVSDTILASIQCEEQRQKRKGIETRRTNGSGKSRRCQQRHV